MYLGESIVLFKGRKVGLWTFLWLPGVAIVVLTLFLKFDGTLNGVVTGTRCSNKQYVKASTPTIKILMTPLVNFTFKLPA